MKKFRKGLSKLRNHEKDKLTIIDLSSKPDEAEEKPQKEHKVPSFYLDANKIAVKGMKRKSKTG